MNLNEIREGEKRAPGRIHQSSPKTPSYEPSYSGKYDYTTHSFYCQIGPTANHAACQATWCKCVCHEHHEYYCG